MFRMKEVNSVLVKMKKQILLFMMGLVLLTTIQACSEYNNFLNGQDIEICSGECLYENDTNLGNYLSCDSSVSCDISLVRANGTFVFSNEQMTRDNTYFKFNATSYNLSSQVFSAKINCERSKGFSDPIDFEVSVSSIAEVDHGGAYPLSSTVLGVSTDIGILKDNLLKKNKFYIGTFIFLLILTCLVYYDVRKNRIKRNSKEIIKEINKGIRMK